MDILVRAARLGWFASAIPNSRRHEALVLAPLTQ